MGFDLEKEMQMLTELEKFDTPTITNVLATYPADKELCLGIYHPWESHWYTDQSLKCIYPGMGPKAGYIVTYVQGLPDPSFTRLNFGDVLRAIDKSPKPVIVAIKQDMPDDIRQISGLSGGNMTTAFQCAGAIGAISDGPSRDIDEIRDMNFQYMLTGICAGHGPYSIRAVNVPVDICGMHVAPGDIVHMDENGAVKFPREYLPQVLDLSKRLVAFEEEKRAQMRAATDVEALIKGFFGQK